MRNPAIAAAARGEESYAETGRREGLTRQRIGAIVAAERETMKVGSRRFWLWVCAVPYLAWEAGGEGAAAYREGCPKRRAAPLGVVWDLLYLAGVWVGGVIGGVSVAVMVSGTVFWVGSMALILSLRLAGQAEAIPAFDDMAWWGFDLPTLALAVAILPASACGFVYEMCRPPSQNR